MSVELRRSRKETLAIRGGAWSFLLMLAEAYRWRPAGTRLPATSKRRKKWDGGYSTSDGQQVSQDDAVALASALERAVADRSYRRKAKRVSTELNKQVRNMALAEYGIDFPPDFDENNTLPKDAISEIARFVHRGAFSIR